MFFSVLLASSEVVVAEAAVEEDETHRLLFSSSELILCNFGKDNPFSAPSYKTPATAAVAEEVEVTVMSEAPSSARCPQPISLQTPM